MVRGVIHLLLYRVVYYYLTLAPSEVHGPGDLAQYMVANFLLYLRVSGLFHLIVGMLHLFGFRLPETHHQYFLASSFTDFWRRINIYWKDFMLKVFYYPAYFRLKPLGNTAALVARDAVRLPDDLVPARLPVVLAARHLPLRLAGHPLLGDPRPARGRRTRSGRSKHGRERKLGKAAVDAGAASATLTSEDRRHVLLHLRPVVVLDDRIDRRVASDCGSAVGEKVAADLGALHGRSLLAGRAGRSHAPAVAAARSCAATKPSHGPRPLP